jgi:hypothetical protein
MPCALSQDPPQSAPVSETLWSEPKVRLDDLVDPVVESGSVLMKISRTYRILVQPSDAGDRRDTNVFVQVTSETATARTRNPLGQQSLLDLIVARGDIWNLRQSKPPDPLQSPLDGTRISRGRVVGTTESRWSSGSNAARHVISDAHLRPRAATRPLSP